MFERSTRNVKVEPRSTFTFTRGLSYIASLSFTHANFTCVRTEKIRVSGNQPLRALAYFTRSAIVEKNVRTFQGPFTHVSHINL